MARSTKSPGDFTGRQSEKRAQESREELERRQNEIATTQRLEQEHDDSVIIDYSDPEYPKEIPATSVPIYENVEGGVIEEEGVELVNPELQMVVVRPIDTVTFVKGYGNKYELKAGQRIRVPKHVADHLEEKGLIA